MKPTESNPYQAPSDVPAPAELPIAPKQELPRILSLFDAIMLVIGGIIGSGIFMKPGRAAAELDATGPILAVWIGVGIMTLFGALVIAELSAMYPQAGGPYVYLREAFGKFWAFLWGWTEFWVVRSAALGTLATGTVIYLEQFIGESTLARLVGDNPLSLSVTRSIATAAIIWILALIHMRSTRQAASIQNLTTIIKTTFLMALIVSPWLFTSLWLKTPDPVMPTSLNASFWSGIVAAMIAVAWPYHGWIDVSTVSEEIKDPQRNVPRAISLGVIAVIFLYVLANIAYHLVLSIEEIRASKAVASDLFRRLFGEWGAKIVSLGVMSSMLGAVNSNILVSPRIYYSMARDKLLPGIFARVHPAYLTPATSILMQVCWTTILLIVIQARTTNVRDTFDALSDFVVFGSTIFYTLAVVAVFKLRASKPDLLRPYRTWGYPFTPIVFVLFSAVFLGGLLVKNPMQSLAGTSIMLAGAVFYFFWSRSATRTSWDETD